MRITILTLGSRGDVQPYIALGVGLQRIGHTVTLAAPQLFASLVREQGLGFAPMRFNPQEFVFSPQVMELLTSRYAILRFHKLRQLIDPMFDAIMEDTWAACGDAQGIVASGTSYSAIDCAEMIGVPLIVGLLQPLRMTSAFPTFALPPGPKLGSYLNRASHRMFELVFWQAFRAPLNRWRRRFLRRGPIPPNVTPFDRMRTAGVPWLFGYSQHVLPRPNDWKEDCHITGYWFLDPPTTWQPPAELVAFLDAGPRPVAIGFGSMAQGDPSHLTKLVLDALRLSGQRAVLLKGWGNVGGAKLPAHVLAVEAVPHSWLFPRVAAAAHHGGAGTTGASLRAGLPTVITPFLFDQYWWAETVARQGFGPRAAPITQIDATQLANALNTASSNAAMRERTTALGAAIRTERGVDNAVALIQKAFR